MSGPTPGGNNAMMPTQSSFSFDSFAMQGKRKKEPERAMSEGILLDRGHITRGCQILPSHAQKHQATKWFSSELLVYFFSFFLESAPAFHKQGFSCFLCLFIFTSVEVSKQVQIIVFGIVCDELSGANCSGRVLWAAGNERLFVPSLSIELSSTFFLICSYVSYIFFFLSIAGGMGFHLSVLI
jgi:hypothetical protein